MERPLCGILNLDKPSGVTSRDVVNRVARPLRKTKVGHAGTLDPLATGVLVVCVGAATRLISLIQQMPKTYRTVIRLGARSDTLDADGEIVAVESPPIATATAIRAALSRQVGTIAQQPPEYSALKVGGRRAYDLARAGQAVDLAPRSITIERIDLRAYDWPRIELEIDCGSGTYIRSIARDLGEALSCGGFVEVLERTRIGPFTRQSAVDPMQLTPETIPGLLRPAIEAAASLPRLALSAPQVADVARGRALTQAMLGGRRIPQGEMALTAPDGELVALAEGVPESALVVPRRVLVKP